MMPGSTREPAFCSYCDDAGCWACDDMPDLDPEPVVCALCGDAPAGGDGFCSDECARGAANEVGVDQRVHEDLEYEAWT
jgi:hypothetical protein